MKEFICMAIKSKDGCKTLGIKFEGLEYEEAKEMIIEHLEYVYRKKRFGDSTIEIRFSSSPISDI